jgi:hypothetical protein
MSRKDPIWTDKVSEYRDDLSALLDRSESDAGGGKLDTTTAARRGTERPRSAEWGGTWEFYSYPRPDSPD